MSRLKEARYQTYSNYNWGHETARYNTPAVSYDLNGNILSMKRRGVTGLVGVGAFGLIDDLTYNYAGNRLQSVADAIAPATYPDPVDFQDRATLSVEYLYDMNGNIIEDKNAGFDDIIYNHLNKPTQIHQIGTGNVLHIVYSADGIKLRQKSGTEILDYSTGYLYRNGEMLYFAHEEGRCLRTATQQTGGSHPVLEPMFRYEYNLKDHLGNVRVSFTTGANGLPLVLQEQHYEAYGLEMGGLSYRSGEENRYLYNGKERVDEFGLSWYDYGFRWLDAKIGRFVSVDPLAEKFYYYTTYQYAGNTPIQARDLDGAEPDYVAGANQDASKSKYDGTKIDLNANYKKNFGISYEEVKVLDGYTAIRVYGTNKSAAKAADALDLPGDSNGPADAYRHGLWSALLTSRVGSEKAKAITDAHELGWPNAENETNMDQYNNNMGRAIATKNPLATENELQILVLEALVSGKLVMMNNYKANEQLNDGSLIPTTLTNQENEDAHQRIYWMNKGNINLITNPKENIYERLEY